MSSLVTSDRPSLNPLTVIINRLHVPVLRPVPPSYVPCLTYFAPPFLPIIILLLFISSFSTKQPIPGLTSPCVRQTWSGRKFASTSTECRWEITRKKSMLKRWNHQQFGQRASAPGQTHSGRRNASTNPKRSWGNTGKRISLLRWAASTIWGLVLRKQGNNEAAEKFDHVGARWAQMRHYQEKNIAILFSVFLTWPRIGKLVREISRIDHLYTQRCTKECSRMHDWMRGDSEKGNARAIDADSQRKLLDSSFIVFAFILPIYFCDILIYGSTLSFPLLTPDSRIYDDIYLRFLLRQFPPSWSCSFVENVGVDMTNFRRCDETLAICGGDHRTVSYWRSRAASARRVHLTSNNLSHQKEK